MDKVNERNILDFLGSDRTQSKPKTVWTEDQWKEEYHRITRKSPEAILKHFENTRYGPLVDIVREGVKYDRRNPKHRGKGEYRTEPGNWYLLYILAKIVETKHSTRTFKK